MEGVAAEAASLAGHLGLGRLVYLYDDNRHLARRADRAELRHRGRRASASRPTAGTSSEVDDANDLERAARSRSTTARREEERPTLIRVQVDHRLARRRTSRARARRTARRSARTRCARRRRSWAGTPTRTSSCPTASTSTSAPSSAAARCRREWERALRRSGAPTTPTAPRSGTPRGGRAGRCPGVAEALRDVDWGKDKLATRAAGQKAMAAFAPFVPTMVGGAADLSESTKTEFPGGDDERYTREPRRRATSSSACASTAWAAPVNGMAAHGGIVRPYGSTFLQFADYMRGAIRLSALTGAARRVGLHARLGRPRRGRPDAPAGRAPRGAARDPGPDRLRPGDANETAAAWRVILEDLEGPARARPLAPGPAVLADASDGGRRARAPTCCATPRTPSGHARRHRLGGRASRSRRPTGSPAEGIGARVVSMPSWELFAAQDDGLPRRRSCRPALPKVSVEAGVSMGWERWVDRAVSIERFGASAPGRRGAREARHHPARTSRRSPRTTWSRRLLA